MVARPNFIILAISEQRVILASALRNRPTIKNSSTRMIHIDGQLRECPRVRDYLAPAEETLYPRTAVCKNMID